MNDQTKIEGILAGYEGASRDALIPILQKVQEECGFLSKEAVVQIGNYLHLPTSKIFGVATFYNQFRFHKSGQCHIQVCRGTACHVKGSAAVLAAFERQLGIKADETTKDGRYSLEVVACIGACGLAPVITANGEFHAKIQENDVKKTVGKLEKQLDKKGTAQ